MKKLLSFIMVFTMCITMLTVPAWASERTDDDANFDYAAFEAQDRENLMESPEVSPQWDYTSSTTQNLTVENREATAGCSVIGYKGKVQKIAVYMYIQQKDGNEWKVIDGHRYQFDTWYCSKEITYSPCPHGYTYRLKTSYYVYYDTAKYEAIDAYSNNFVYN